MQGHARPEKHVHASNKPHQCQRTYQVCKPDIDQGVVPRNFLPVPVRVPSDGVSQPVVFIGRPRRVALHLDVGHGRRSHGPLQLAARLLLLLLRLLMLVLVLVLVLMLVLMLVLASYGAATRLSLRRRPRGHDET